MQRVAFVVSAAMLIGTVYGNVEQLFVALVASAPNPMVIRHIKEPVVAPEAFPISLYIDHHCKYIISRIRDVSTARNLATKKGLCSSPVHRSIYVQQNLELPAVLQPFTTRIALVVVPLDLDFLATDRANLPDGVLLDMAAKRHVVLVIGGIFVPMTVIIIVVAHMFLLVYRVIGGKQAVFAEISIVLAVILGIILSAVEINVLAVVLGIILSGEVEHFIFTPSASAMTKRTSFGICGLRFGERVKIVEPLAAGTTREHGRARIYSVLVHRETAVAVCLAPTHLNRLVCFHREKIISDPRLTATKIDTFYTNVNRLMMMLVCLMSPGPLPSRKALRHKHLHKHIVDVQQKAGAACATPACNAMLPTLGFRLARLSPCKQPLGDHDPYQF